MFIAPRIKNSLYFRKRNFLTLRLKKFLYLLKKPLLLFQETKLFKKTSYFSGSNFQAQKARNSSEKIYYIFSKKAFFIFQEMEISYIS